MELLEFTMSHFCEKARWILDFKRLRYRIVTLVPGPHLWTTRRLGLRRSWVPVLRDGGHIIQGSAQIIEYVERLAPSPPLVPETAEGRALVARIDRDVGEALRAVVYDVLIAEAPQEVLRLWAQDGPWWASAVVRAGFPLLRAGLRAQYRLNPTHVASEAQRFDTMFRDLEARLQHGPYLEGTRFGLADLTAAALLAPLCRPPDHHVAWPPQLPPGLRDFEARYSDSTTWRWVHQMYRLHRHVARE